MPGLLSLLEVAPVESALATRFSDYEDAVTCEAARQANVDVIVTRNTRDFAKADLPVHTPLDLIALLEAAQS